MADIIHVLNVSVASKVGALAARLGKKNPGEYMMTGGVAKNQGIINALEEKLVQNSISAMRHSSGGNWEQHYLPMRNVTPENRL